MKNQEKFKTAEERIENYAKFCNGHTCDNCPLSGNDKEIRHCGIKWLELEAEEKPLPCPFCGSKAMTNGCMLQDKFSYWVDCTNPNCGYQSGHQDSREDAVVAHNRVAQAVMDAKKEGETK